MKTEQQIPVIIPSLEPDDKLILLVQHLQTEGIHNIVIVDDGSGPDYACFFERARGLGCIVLTHAINLGKGRALKTAFNHCLTTYPNLIGAVTADSDGQHSVADIRKCMDCLINNDSNLVLGCRDFSAKDIPPKNRFGNEATRTVMGLLCGIRLTDTQTGLRGIPSRLMKAFLETKGERFEYETNMLIDNKQLGYGFQEVPIETIFTRKIIQRTLIPCAILFVFMPFSPAFCYRLWLVP